MLRLAETIQEDHFSYIIQSFLWKLWTEQTGTISALIMLGSLLQEKAWLLLQHMLADMMCSGLPQAYGCLASMTASLPRCWQETGASA